MSGGRLTTTCKYNSRTLKSGVRRGQLKMRTSTALVDRHDLCSTNLKIFSLLMLLEGTVVSGRKVMMS